MQYTTNNQYKQHSNIHIENNRTSVYSTLCTFNNMVGYKNLDMVVYGSVRILFHDNRILFRLFCAQNILYLVDTKHWVIRNRLIR